VKRRIFSVLFALVLVLALMPVMAVPVAAQDEMPDAIVFPFELGGKAGGNYIAEYSTTQIHTGSSSVHLATTGTVGNGDEARIRIDFSAFPEGEMPTLGDIESISWYEYLVTGYPPHVDIKVDTDGDGIEDDALVIEYAYNTVAHYGETYPTYGALTGEWYQTFSDDGNGPAVIGDTANAWPTTGPAGPPADVCHTLAEWKAGITYGSKTIDASTSVLALEIEVDNWGVQSEAYVDDIVINDMPVFGQIQDAIDAAEAGDTITVAAGTYSTATGETFPITVTRSNITIQGAGEGSTIIDASGAVGGVHITSSNGVTFTGFTIKNVNGTTAALRPLYLLTASNCLISDVLITDCGSPTKTTDALYLYTGSTNNILTNITVQNINSNSTAAISVSSGSNGNTFTSITISGLTATGGWADAIPIYGSENNEFTDITISNVTGAQKSRGITLFGSTAKVAKNNTFSNVNISSLQVVSGTAVEPSIGIKLDSAGGGNPSGNTFTNCTISGAEYGIRIYGNCPDNAINYSNIVGNTEYGAYSDTVSLNAENNWWNNASGPTDATKNPLGTGDAVSDKVDYIPWLNAAAPGGVATYLIYNSTTGVGYETIQAAINAATAGNTITVKTGTYSNTGIDAETFPITVNKANLTIRSVSGAATTIIDSVDTGRVIAISAAGVTIGGTDKGFIIEGTGAKADGLIYIGANDATITENRFVGDYYLMVLAPGVSGAMVEDNTFLTYFAITANEVTGIYVNNDVTGSTFDGNSFPLGSDPTRYVDSGIYLATGTTADQTITISNNIFEGMGLRTIGEDSFGCAAIELAGVGGITIESNTIVNSNDGIWFEGAALTGDVTIQNNTITDNAWGIEVKDGVGIIGTITANYNNLAGNTTYGLLNEETDITVDAEYNWWGDIAGPDTSTKTTLHNPYEGWAGNAVSDYVDYIPWLIRTDLVVDFEGWNIVSFPIWVEEEEEPSPEPAEIVGIYYFDSFTQYWGADPYEANPLDAYYVKVTAPISFIYPVSSEVTFPSQKEMKVGWNFVGLAELYEMEASEALLDAYYGTGEAELFGYTKVISPSLNGVSWTFLRPAIMKASSPDMLPTKGYWVFMVNDGVLGGFTSTPIVEVKVLP